MWLTISWSYGNRINFTNSLALVKHRFVLASRVGHVRHIRKTRNKQSTVLMRNSATACQRRSSGQRIRTQYEYCGWHRQPAAGSASPDEFHKSHRGATDHWARTSRRMKAISIVHAELLGTATVLPWQDEQDEETQERRIRPRRKLKPISGNHASSIYGASHVANLTKYYRDSRHYCATDNYGPVYWWWLRQSLTSHYILWSRGKRIADKKQNWSSCTSLCALRRKPICWHSDIYRGLL